MHTCEQIIQQPWQRLHSQCVAERMNTMRRRDEAQRMWNTVSVYAIQPINKIATVYIVRVSSTAIISQTSPTYLHTYAVGASILTVLNLQSQCNLQVSLLVQLPTFACE